MEFIEEQKIETLGIEIYFIDKETYSKTTTIGYFDLQTAIENCPSGYSVYDSEGNKKYTKPDYEKMWNTLIDRIKDMHKDTSNHRGTIETPELAYSFSLLNKILEIANEIEKEGYKDEQNRCI